MDSRVDVCVVRKEGGAEQKVILVDACRQNIVIQGKFADDICGAVRSIHYGRKVVVVLGVVRDQMAIRLQLSE